MRLSLLVSLSLIACAHAPVAVPSSNVPEAVVPDLVDEAVMPPPALLDIKVRLRGTNAAGLVVTKNAETPAYLGAGSDIALEVESGATLTFAAEALARLNTGGSRVVSWGMPDCPIVRDTCILTPTASATITIVLEEIVYVGRSAQVDNLFAMSFDGSNSRQLTHFTAPGLVIKQLRVSPNGESLIYVSNRAVSGIDSTGEARNLWLDGTALTKSINADSTDPEWAPDSASIVFASRLPLTDTGVVNSTSNIWRIGTATRSAHPITALSHASAQKPSLSSDGLQLVYISNRDPSGADSAAPMLLWLATADGSMAHTLSEIPAAIQETPRFDATGALVVFGACDTLSCSARSGATVRGAWPMTSAFAAAPQEELGTELSIAHSIGAAGALVLSEGATAYHLRAFGWTLDKTYPVGTVHDFAFAQSRNAQTTHKTVSASDHTASDQPDIHT